MKLFLAALLLAIATVANAGSLQGSAVVDPQSTLKNPVSGGLALESDYWTRVGLQFSGPRRVSGTLDLIGRDEDSGFVFGLGLVADDIQSPVFVNETATTDSTVVITAHDHGKHKGDKHNHGNKTVITVHNGTAYVSIGGLDLNLVPSAFIGVSAYRGLFVESRVLFNGGDVSNRVSVGLRW